MEGGRPPTVSRARHQKVGRVLDPAYREFGNNAVQPPEDRVRLSDPLLIWEKFSILLCVSPENFGDQNFPWVYNLCEPLESIPKSTDMSVASRGVSNQTKKIGITALQFRRARNHGPPTWIWENRSSIRSTRTIPSR